MRLLKQAGDSMFWNQEFTFEFTLGEPSYLVKEEKKK